MTFAARLYLALTLPIGLAACVSDSPVDRPDSGVPVDPFDVNGLTVDEYGTPVDGVLVEVEDTVYTSAGGGKFRAPHVRSKYTATAGWTQGLTQLVSYVDLTTRTPVIHLRDYTRKRKPVKFTGTLSGGGADYLACGFASAGTTNSGATATAFNLDVGWWNPPPSDVRLIFVSPAQPQPSGAKVIDTTIPTSKSALGVLNFEPNIPVTFRWSSPVQALVSLVDADGMKCLIGGSGGGTTATVPFVPDARAAIAFTGPSGTSGINADVPLSDKDFGAITFPPDVKLTSPAAGSTLDESTAITWQANAGTTAVGLSCLNQGFTSTIVVGKASTLLPEVKVQNDVKAARPRGATCSLFVTTTGAKSSTDEWAVAGADTPLSSYSSDSISLTVAP